MSFNFMTAVTICNDFEVQENKSLTVTIFSPSDAPSWGSIHVGGADLQGCAPLTGGLLQSPTRPRLPCQCPSGSAQRRCWGNACQNEMTGCLRVLALPVVIYGCESWTIKKAECRRIDAFELWCWRRRLRVPWMPRRPNQSS